MVSVGYRLGAGTAPAAVDDAVCALGWVADRADELGFDRDRIVVSGASAGGHLALMAGILGSGTEHECAPDEGFRVAGIVNWFGITDIEAVEAYLAEARPRSNYARSWIGDTARVSRISDRHSPIRRVGDDAPPILTLHGDEDSVVPYEQATRFHARLNELGVTHRLETMEGGTHMGFSDAQFQRAFGTIFRFLESADAGR